MKPMRVLLALTATALLGLHLAPCPAAEEPEKSAFQRDPTGWIDVMPRSDLKGWKRLHLPPDTKLAAKNPWSVDAANKLLLCDGDGVKEMFLEEKPRGDGVFHVEWRFRPRPGKPPYNGGIYVRCSPDGATWHQIQVAHLTEPPFLGDLFTDQPDGDKLKRVVVRGQGEKRAKAPGEWNTFEISMKGKSIHVWINGATTLTWDECPVREGLLGLQAEYYFVEFRNLLFKPAK